MPRLLGWTKRVVTSALLAAMLAWLCLHTEAVYERRKAARFISELSTFPFATADFAQVREFVIRHGGGPVRTNSESATDSCTPRDCQFELEFLPATTRVLRKQKRFFVALDKAENYLALRPWMVTITFTVKDGLLQHTRTTIAQDRIRRSGDYDQPVLISYEVDTDLNSTPYSDTGLAETDYTVSRPHVTGAPSDLLHVWAMQKPAGRWKRSFDVHLDCLTRVSRGCMDFRELAPSAWEDYERGRSAG